MTQQILNLLDALSSIASTPTAGGHTDMTTQKRMHAVTPFILYLQDVVADDTINFITHMLPYDKDESVPLL